MSKDNSTCMLYQIHNFALQEAFLLSSRITCIGKAFRQDITSVPGSDVRLPEQKLLEEELFKGTRTDKD